MHYASSDTIAGGARICATPSQPRSAQEPVLPQVKLDSCATRGRAGWVTHKAELRGKVIQALEHPHFFASRAFFPVHVRKAKGKRPLRASDATEQINPGASQAPEGRAARTKPESQLRGRFSLEFVSKHLWFKVPEEIQLFSYTSQQKLKYRSHSKT